MNEIRDRLLLTLVNEGLDSDEMRLMTLLACEYAGCGLKSYRVAFGTKLISKLYNDGYIWMPKDNVIEATKRGLAVSGTGVNGLISFLRKKNE